MCAVPGGLGAPGCGSVRVVCLWRGPCVSVSERVRADTATAPPSAAALPRRGPPPGRGPGRGVRQGPRPGGCRPPSPARRAAASAGLSAARPLPPPLPAGSFHGHTHAHGGHSRGAGAATGFAAAAAAPGEAAAAPRTAELRAPAGRVPGPAPPRSRLTSRGRVPRRRPRIQQLEGNLPRGGPPKRRSAPQRPPEDALALRIHLDRGRPPHLIRRGVGCCVPIPQAKQLRLVERSDSPRSHSALDIRDTIRLQVSTLVPKLLAHLSGRMPRGDTGSEAA